jgi:hypothetical protein
MINMRKMKATLVLTAIIMTLSLVIHASGASVTPELWEDWQSGNAEFECGQISSGGDIAYKIDEWGGGGMDGDYVYAGNTITISNSDGKTFDWASEYPVVAIIVKAGTKAYVYRYGDGGVLSDTGLVAPEGKDISHVSFCMDVPDLVIPETPIGTIGTILTMLGAAVLLRIKTIFVK